MLNTLPTQAEAMKHWSWDQIAPYFEELNNHPLSADTLHEWLADWTRLSNLLSEVFARARVATTQDTTDEQADAHLKHLLATIYPPMMKANNALDQKLLASGLEPGGFAVPLRNMRADVALFREANLPLQTRDQALGMAFARIMGAQTVMFEGEEKTLTELSKISEDQDRARREAAFRLGMERWLQDREAINALWTQFYPLRQEMARSAGFADYRAYAWQQRRRFEYTPQDCETFHDAIEQVVVPAVERMLAKRQAALGVVPLRPWDLDVDPEGRPPLRPWETIEDFAAKAQTVFTSVYPRLGEYFGMMRADDLLDLPNRKGKGPGAYCTRFAASERPFIFMNAVGTQGDVRTLLHEAGHAFHGFEVLKLPYAQQQGYPIEYAEVASMAMELLAAPYLTKDQGGYFDPADAARDRIKHLTKILGFWPYMAVVDAFQQWAYTHPEGGDPAACDATWGELWDRFMRGVDWGGDPTLEAARLTGWHRKHHIFRYPFYYIEYGLAQLGAVQVWANALRDQAGAVEQYLHGLALGYTVTLPELYAATGARLAFDAGTLGEAVDLIEHTITTLEAQL